MMSLIWWNLKKMHMNFFTKQTDLQIENKRLPVGKTEGCMWSLELITLLYVKHDQQGPTV